MQTSQIGIGFLVFLAFCGSQIIFCYHLWISELVYLWGWDVTVLFCISFLTALKQFWLCAPSVRPKRHKNIIDVAWFSLNTALHPYIICESQLCVSAASWRPLAATNRERKKCRKKGTLICMWGASLDKAEDNKECILSHSDESLLHPKVTSKWARADPHLHFYQFFYIYIYFFT